MDKKLWNKNYTLLWLGQTVSQLGDGAGYIALVWWIQVSTGSALALGSFAMAKSTVRVLLSPVAGVIADRFSRKWIIFWTDIIRGFIYLGLSYGAFTGALQFYHVVLAGILTTALHSFFIPSIISALPSIVPKDELAKANSFRQMTANISQILSYAVGGVLVVTIGVPALLLADGISYILSAISELFIDIPLVDTKKKTFNKNVFVEDLKAGLAYIKTKPLLVKLLKVSISVNLFIAPVMVLLPKFVDDNLQASGNVLGLLLSSLMAGMLFATVIIAFFNLGDKYYHLSRVSVFFTGASLIAFGIAPVEVWYLHSLILFIMGFFMSMVNIYVDTIMQKIIQPNMLGKVFGFLRSVAGGLQPLSQGSFSVVANYTSVGIVFLICGVPMASIGVPFAKMKELRESAVHNL